MIGTTPVINYTPDTIDEYIVIVNLPEDWEVVHNYIINENETDGIPNRKINCSNVQEFSLRSAIYEMSTAEAETLKTHSKVESVELNPDKYPQPRSSLSTARFGNVVAFPKPRLSRALMGTSAPIYTPSTSTTNGVRANWSQLFVDNPSSEPYQGNSITPTDNVDRDINYSYTGSGVDVVVIDDGMSVLHPDFIAGDGSYRVFDVILDGPYKVDPAAFSGYTTTVTIDGVNIGTRAQEARARLWWSDTTIRSTAYQSVGTLSIPDTYTRIHAHSKNGTNSIVNGHGTACASQIGGKHHGLAFGCNLWNIRISFGVGNGVLTGSTALNACTIFHKAKKVPGTIADPTLINNSWAFIDQTGNTYNTSYSTGYRGSTLTYTGTGVPNDGNGKDFSNLIQSNVGAARNYTWAVVKPSAASANVIRYSLSEDTGGYYLKADSTASSAAENAISEGCIVLAAAGNFNQKLSDKTDTDFNNWYDTSSTYINRVTGVQKGFSGDHDTGKGTIRVGGVDCAVEPTDEKQAVAKYKIRKVSYSSNGPMIDIFSPAEATMAAAYASYESKFDAVARVDDSNYKDRAFDGTSSACPNTAAVIALYLQTHRDADQATVRTWLTGKACKTNLLSDPYSSSSSTYYWSANYNASTDLPGNIFEGYNVRGNGNLRGAPNRVLFNSTTIVPTLSSSVPVDDATGVALNTNIVLNFSEAVTALSTGSIYIFKVASPSHILVETFLATSSKVTGSGTNQITVNPTSDLAANSIFYVLIDPKAFADSDDNYYAGIAASGTIRFTTGSGSDPDPDPPDVDGEYSVRFFGNGLTLNGQLVIT